MNKKKLSKKQLLAALIKMTDAPPDAADRVPEKIALLAVLRRLVK